MRNKIIIALLFVSLCGATHVVINEGGSDLVAKQSAVATLNGGESELLQQRVIESQRRNVGLMILMPLISVVGTALIFRKELRVIITNNK